jgi:hypothetical protein
MKQESHRLQRWDCQSHIASAQKTIDIHIASSQKIIDKPPLSLYDPIILKLTFKITVNQ